MRVVKNYLYNAAYQIFVLLVPLLTTPYLARVLGPQGVGINAFTNATIQYFIIFGSVGVALYGNRQIAYVRGDRQKLTNTFYEIFLMRMITIGIAFLAFFVFLTLIHKNQIYYVAQSFSLLAAAFDISWFFQGVENFAVTVLRNFVVKIITLISIFTFVKSYHDLALYILILSLSLLIGNLTLFPSLKRYIGKPDWANLHLFQHLAPSLVLFVPEIATQIYLYVNKTMLGVFTNYTQAGFFDQSDKIVKLSLAVVTATGTVMLPHVANAFQRGELQQVKKYLYTTFEFVTCLAVPLTFGIAAVAHSFVPLFFSPKFMPVIPLMMLESIVVLLIAWSNAIGVQYLVPTGQNRAYNYSVILGALVNIFANVPLILLWSSVGTALATVISEVVVTGYQLYAIRNQINLRQLFAGYLKYLVAGLVMFIIVFWLDLRLPDTWLMLMIEIIVGILTYLILILILRPKLIDRSLSMIKNRLA
ncbi:Membrane protein involved in the export of O-antigen, teichoic acid lipoteichoic acid [Fructilactobacillus florum 8D]|uniref:Membrane protein involved in the export of O-antigen, teichoic acid lipoteichoic acid n=2 Tax=Fructilactobacillus florum TaxID=640331 RepID=W9EFU8_9LACO|nr:polysaccharide biosynthesis C-terminal domain-containing protein [Fructilactobacillus florum]ETO41008.1 Membrane protein involved in the export of O-antigen, teichoic acid lipoteichoic acid [Fructilactobacillus florum 8D]KRM92280.1 PST family polysaccharide transporter [Fructilactobacillus florum DSM 22689 = JCM 16035]